MGQNCRVCLKGLLSFLQALATLAHRGILRLEGDGWSYLLNGFVGVADLLGDCRPKAARAHRERWVEFVLFLPTGQTWV